MINRSATVNWFLPFVPFSIFFAVLLHLLFLSLQSKCHRPQLSHKSSVRQLMWITGVEFSWREHCSFSPVIWLEQANSALWSTATSTATSLFQKHPKSCSWFPFGGKPKIKHFAKKSLSLTRTFCVKARFVSDSDPPCLVSCEGRLGFSLSSSLDRICSTPLPPIRRSQNVSLSSAL